MTTVDADRLLRDAYEHAYRYAPDFGGFRADVAYRADDGTVVAGTVVATPGQTPELRVEDALAEAELAWLRHEVGMIAGHRWHRPYVDADGRWQKTAIDTDHPLGTLIEVADAMESSYRVRDGEITQINRTHGASRFSIAVQGRTSAPDGRTLSTAFAVSYRDAVGGRLFRAEAYTDEYVNVDAALLPRLRRIVTSDDSGSHVREIELSRHEVLAPVGEAR